MTARAVSSSSGRISVKRRLAVGPAIEYVRVKCRNPYTGQPQTVVLARELLPSCFTKKMEGTYEVLPGTLKGPELEGIRYEQLIPWVKPAGDAFRVILGDYVTTSDGTGVVHIAPTFGADDDRVARAAGIADRKSTRLNSSHRT